MGHDKADVRDIEFNLFEVFGPFVTSGDWDPPENILHLVLPRPDGVDGAQGRRHR